MSLLRAKSFTVRKNSFNTKTSTLNKTTGTNVTNIKTLLNLNGFTHGVHTVVKGGIP